MLLILDIDETLVFTSETRPVRPPDFQFEDFNVLKRPFLDDFLRYCFASFSVGIWTSSTKDYATQIAANILQEGQELEFLWARDRCTAHYDSEMQNLEYLKDLKKIKRKGYNLGQVIVVDNTPNKLVRSYGNLVRIDDFVGDQDDRELLSLRNYLNDLAHVPDVRAVEKRGWKSRYSV